MTSQPEHSRDETERDGDMGISSERVGPTGPGQVSTSGERPTSPSDHAEREDEPPEQRPGNEERNPVGLNPKAGYPEADPRHE